MSIFDGKAFCSCLGLHQEVWPACFFRSQLDLHEFCAPRVTLMQQFECCGQVACRKSGAQTWRQGGGGGLYKSLMLRCFVIWETFGTFVLLHFTWEVKNSSWFNSDSFSWQHLTARSLKPAIGSATWMLEESLKPICTQSGIP